MVSESSIAALRNIYDALNSETGPFSELDFPKSALKNLKELVNGGFIEYRSGGIISITPDGIKCLNECYPLSM